MPEIVAGSRDLSGTKVYQQPVTGMIVAAGIIWQLNDNVGVPEVLRSADDIAALAAVCKISTEYPARMQRLDEVLSKPSLATVAPIAG